MINVEDALNEIFTYKRNEKLLLKALITSSTSVKYHHLDKTFVNIQIGIYGVCPILYDGTRGTELVYYTAEQNFGKLGAPLPSWSRGLMDCPYVHFSILLNCLAYLTGQNVSRLTLCRVANGCELVPIQVHKMYTEIFLSNISNKPVNQVPIVNQHIQFPMFKN